MVGAHTGGDDLGMVKVEVDLTGCGFTSAPIVHTMLNGEAGNIRAEGAASGIRGLTAAGFRLNIFNVYKVSVEKATANNWEILWTASGYGC